MGGLDAVARAAALVIGGDVRIGRQVDLRRFGPVQDRRGIAVGGGELVAHQVILAFKLGVHVAQARTQPLAGDFPVIVRDARQEDRRQVLVQLGADEAQPVHQLVPLRRAGGRDQAFFGMLVGEVLDDHAALAEPGAVLHFHVRHVAFRVVGPEVGPVAELLFHQIDGDQFGFDAELAHRDMGGERAGALGVIQFHSASPIGV